MNRAFATGTAVSVLLTIVLLLAIAMLHPWARDVRSGRHRG
jgi:F0F1-type ATP synthase assembly protein I